MEIDTKDISCCFDKESSRMLEDYRRDGLGDTSEKILSTLKGKGVSGLSSLELGCGVGALTIALAKEGLASAVGLDLSPQMVAAARSLAAEGGFTGSVTFEVGDGAKVRLRPSDLVILDSVVCCYPDPETLIDNTSGAALRFYALALPDDTRPATRILRVFLPLQSIFIRRGSFRFYVHKKDRLMKRLEGSGFTRVFDSPIGWIWSVVVFAAPVRS